MNFKLRAAGNLPFSAATVSSLYCSVSGGRNSILGCIMYIIHLLNANLHHVILIATSQIFRYVELFKLQVEATSVIY